LHLWVGLTLLQLQVKQVTVSNMPIISTSSNNVLIPPYIKKTSRLSKEVFSSLSATKLNEANKNRTQLNSSAVAHPIWSRLNLTQLPKSALSKRNLIKRNTAKPFTSYQICRIGTHLIQPHHSHNIISATSYLYKVHRIKSQYNPTYLSCRIKIDPIKTDRISTKHICLTGTYLIKTRPNPTYLICQIQTYLKTS